MHCQRELEEDLQYDGLIPDEVMLKWFRDSYSSSKHLLTLYSVAIGLKAKSILEIGFGRSSFVLIKAAADNGGILTTCDTQDFSYLLNAREKSFTTFVHGTSDNAWSAVEQQGVDFAFLDYFSSENITQTFIEKEIRKCISLMKTNGVIAIHDAIVEKYRLKKVLEDVKVTLGLFHNSDVEVVSIPYNYGLGLIRLVKKSPYGIITDGFKKKSD